MVEHVIILAGGSGTRLWPASVKAHPKQFMRLSDGRSLMQLTLARAMALGISGSLLVVTHHSQAELVAAHAAELAQSDRDAAGDLLERLVVIPEPEARNTAPAIALAYAWLAQQASGEDTAAILTADHVIQPVEAFASDMETASKAAAAAASAGSSADQGSQAAGRIVTFGIPPTGPETGFGYIEAGSLIAPAPGSPGAGTAPGGPGARAAGTRQTASSSPAGGKPGPGTGIWSVEAFTEKPDAPTAERFVEAGNFLWNSGMFVAAGSTMRGELAAHSPDIAAVFTDLQIPARFVERHGVKILDAGAELAAVYGGCPANSIDYAVMEQSSLSAVVPASFTWFDIGSWEAFAELYEGNQGLEAEIPPETGSRGSSGGRAQPGSGNFVYSDLPVALAGVEDLMVVVKNGRVLVCKNGSGQDVKKVVNLFKRDERNELL